MKIEQTVKGVKLSGWLLSSKTLAEYKAIREEMAIASQMVELEKKDASGCWIYFSEKDYVNAGGSYEGFKMLYGRNAREGVMPVTNAKRVLSYIWVIEENGEYYASDTGEILGLAHKWEYDDIDNGSYQRMNYFCAYRRYSGKTVQMLGGNKWERNKIWTHDGNINAGSYTLLGLEDPLVYECRKTLKASWAK